MAPQPMGGGDGHVREISSRTASGVILSKCQDYHEPNGRYFSFSPGCLAPSATCFVSFTVRGAGPLYVGSTELSKVRALRTYAKLPTELGTALIHHRCTVSRGHINMLCPRLPDLLFLGFPSRCRDGRIPSMSMSLVTIANHVKFGLSVS